MKKTLWKFSFIFILLALLTGCPGVNGEEDNTQQEQQTSQEQETPKEETQKEPEKQKEPETQQKPETQQEPENQTKPEPPVNQISLTEKIAAATGSIDFENAEIEEDAVISKAILIQNLNLKGKKLTLEATGIELQNVQNAVIIVDQKVGEGDVTLTNCSSITKLEIYGGGSNSIHINNSKIATVEVKKENVRVALEEKSEIEVVKVESANTKIESEETIKINEISVSEVVDKITIKGGTVEKVQVVEAEETTNEKTQIVIDGKTEIKSVEGTNDVQLTKEAILGGSNVVINNTVPIVNYYDSTIYFLSDGDTKGTEFENQDIYYEYIFDIESKSEEVNEMNFKIKIYKLPDTVKVFIYGVDPDYGPMTQEITDKNDTTDSLIYPNSVCIKNWYDETLILKSAGLVKGTFSADRASLDTAVYDKEFDIKDCGIPEKIVLPDSPYKPEFKVTPSSEGNVITVTFNDSDDDTNPNKYISSTIWIHQGTKQNDKWIFNLDNLIFYNDENKEKSITYLDSFVTPGKEYAYFFQVQRYNSVDEEDYVTVTATGGKGEIEFSAENSTLDNGIKLTISDVSYLDGFKTNNPIFRYYENEEDEDAFNAKIEHFRSDDGKILPIVDYYTAKGTSYTYKAKYEFWKNEPHIIYSPIITPCTITATVGVGEPKITNNVSGSVVDDCPIEVTDENGQIIQRSVKLFTFDEPPQIGVNQLVDNATYNITFTYEYSYHDGDTGVTVINEVMYDTIKSDEMIKRNNISDWTRYSHTYKYTKYNVFIRYSNKIEYEYFSNEDLPGMADIIR